MIFLGFRKKKQNVDMRIHEQSPFQAVLKYQDYSTEWLVQKCEEIRALGRDLTGQEISFITFWENLRSVPFDYRSLMKKYIIEDDRTAQFDLIDSKGYRGNVKKNNVVKNIS